MLLFATAAVAPASPRQVTIPAADGVTVYARSYPAPSPKAVILLFHQAGSSGAEYATIAPRLVALGYAALAVDQRAGDGLFGVPNQTAAHLGKQAGYLDALPDLDAALAWGHQTYPKLPIYAWGSSYSASLVFLLAAKHPEIGAVLAFSPGEYFDDKHLVGRAAAQVHAPIFVDSAADPDEIAAARSIVDAASSTHKVQHTAKHGVHGSSTLIAARDPAGADENWAAVLAFLRSI